ncbi:MAG: phosphonate metabolism protein/1,5-bisphosphokinase (PRPP-forming) PhnN [Hyphomicrobiaceae bacterium]
MAEQIETGALVLVVGPSGAGKDTLIDRARAELGQDPRLTFARRIITRASDGISEDNDAISRTEFAAREAAGTFLLSWQAHGLGYAIPGEGRDVLRQSKVLVANVSRTVIGEAERQAQNVVVLHVTAPIDVLAQRIAARGREAADDIAARLARQAPLQVSTAGLVEIVNDRDVDTAARQFNRALVSITEQVAARG